MVPAMLMLINPVERSTSQEFDRISITKIKRQVSESRLQARNIDKNPVVIWVKSCIRKSRKQNHTLKIWSIKSSLYLFSPYFPYSITKSLNSFRYQIACFSRIDVLLAGIALQSFQSCQQNSGTYWGFQRAWEMGRRIVAKRPQVICRTSLQFYRSVSFFFCGSWVYSFGRTSTSTLCFAGGL